MSPSPAADTMQTALASTDAPRVFVGRQPILDRDLNTWAYELLFRRGEGNRADVVDDHLATSRVIQHSLVEIGMDELVGANKAFINFSRASLMSNLASLLPSERVVIEIFEHVTVDEQLVEAVHRLVDAGYVIALDDFEYTDEWLPLIELAQIIKFDVMNTPLPILRQYLRRIGKYKPLLLAEKVETREEYEMFLDMGFNYFQGYFFARPNIVTRARLPDNHLALVRLIARQDVDEAAIDEMEKLVTQSVSLSYKLLRYINSAFLGLPKKVESIQQAVIYFGFKQLKNWATLIAMTEITDKPSELLRMGLVRAKVCEYLAMACGQADAESFYLTGLFSILDVLMDCPMETILDKVPVSDKVTDALLEQKGPIGEALRCAIACERNERALIRFCTLDEQRISSIYVDAINYSNHALP